jgi:hypothetical protein
MRRRGCGRFAGFRSRPVMLSSPHSPGEFLHRLAAVTTRQGFSWYLAARNVGAPDPRFRGDVGPSRILIARFEDTLGRNSFAPWLDIRAEPAADGGTILTGRIGLHPFVGVLIPVILGAGCLMMLGLFSAGVVQLASGQVGQALPFVSLPLIAIAFMVGGNAAGLRSLERGIPELIRDMNEILGAPSDDAAS